MSFCVILGRCAAPAFAFDDFHAGVELVGHDVPIMQKRIFLEADVHERGLEAVFEVADLALENAADQSFFGRALDVEFLELAVLRHRDARFERLGIDDDFLVNLLFRADEPLDFFDEVRGGGFDGFDETFRLLLDRHRLEFFLLHFRRRFQMRFAEIFLFRVMRVRVRHDGFRRRALRRQAGGDVFGALDFLDVAFFKQAFVAALFRDDFGARLRGVAVGFLRVGAETAFGLETHSAAAPREVVIAHISILF